MFSLFSNKHVLQKKKNIIEYYYCAIKSLEV